MNILIVNAHCIVREGLKHIIHSSYRDVVIQETNNGTDALTFLSERKDQFDLVIIDLRLPGIDGLTLLQRLHEAKSDTPILIVSSSEDPEDIEKAFQFGARGFIPKSSPQDKIRDAIVTVLSGDIYHPNNATDYPEPAWAEQHKITGRQMQILRLTRKGKPNSQIAEQLFITERTVKAHVAALFESFGVKNRTELIYRTHQLGLD